VTPSVTARGDTNLSDATGLTMYVSGCTWCVIVQITKMFHSALAVLISSTTLNISPETEAGFDAYDPKLPSRDAIFNNDTCKLQQLQKHIQDELHITTLCQQRKAEAEVEPNLHSTGHTNAKKNNTTFNSHQHHIQTN